MYKMWVQARANSSLHNIPSKICPPQTNVPLEPTGNCLMKARSSGTMIQRTQSPSLLLLVMFCCLPPLCLLRQQPSMHFSMEHPPPGLLFLFQVLAVLLVFQSLPNGSSMWIMQSLKLNHPNVLALLTKILSNLNLLQFLYPRAWQTFFILFTCCIHAFYMILSFISLSTCGCCCLFIHAFCLTSYICLTCIRHEDFLYISCTNLVVVL